MTFSKKQSKSSEQAASASHSPEPSESQFARFVETARKLECDDDKERFEARLGKVAKAKPKRDADAEKPGR